MWIAVCDDDPSFVKVFSCVLSEITNEDDQISVYGFGIDLIAAVQNAKVPIDMLFPDIEMPGLSGIEAARELREVCPSTIIVIITNYMQYALKCYEIKAFGYLLKPVNAKALTEKINDARTITDSLLKDVLHIETRQENIFIPYGDILYFESSGRTLYAYSRTKSYQFHKTISELGREVNNKGFFRLHKSYIVKLLFYDIKIPFLALSLFLDYLIIGIGFRGKMAKKIFLILVFYAFSIIFDTSANIIMLVFNGLFVLNKFAY